MDQQNKNIGKYATKYYEQRINNFIKIMNIFCHKAGVPANINSLLHFQSGQCVGPGWSILYTAPKVLLVSSKAYKNFIETADPDFANEIMDKEELIKKITEKKEFSQLPKKDVEKCFNKFDKTKYVDEEKVKLTRDLLRKVFSVFTSEKLLKIKDRDPEWILKKHISTKERFPYYKEVYKRIFKYFKNKRLSVFDLGAGINGFSYNYFPKGTTYIGVESIGQLVNLMNYYFKTKKLEARAIHESLFELKEIKKYIQQNSGEKIIFLFKVIDSLEMIEDNYSKFFLKEITSLSNMVVVSFATRSLIKKEKFKANRNWIKYFIQENFEIIDEFEIGAERYILFKNIK